MAKKFSYTICDQPDEEIFEKQCVAIEKKITGIHKGELLEDVDGSLYQTYYQKEGEIVVANDCNIGCLYVDSDFDLDSYFK